MQRIFRPLHWPGARPRHWSARLKFGRLGAVGRRRLRSARTSISRARPNFSSCFRNTAPVLPPAPNAKLSDKATPGLPSQSCSPCVSPGGLPPTVMSTLKSVQQIPRPSQPPGLLRPKPPCPLARLLSRMRLKPQATALAHHHHG